MMLWSIEKQREFVREGHVVLPSMVPPELVAAARRVIDERIANGDSATPADFRQHDAIAALFNDSALAPLMQSAIGEPKPVNGGQVAMRFPTARQAYESHGDAPMDNPFGWGGHLDGMNSFFHAEPVKGAGQVANPDDTFMNFDCLVGVALNDQLTDECGNLGLLSRSHTESAAFFAQQRANGGPLGPGGHAWPLKFGNGRALPPPCKQLPGAVEGADGSWYPKPTTIKLRAGDAVLAQ